jgi:hypothetical protein
LGAAFFAAARLTAQRFFIASASLLRPSGVKFVFCAAGVAAVAAGALSTGAFAATLYATAGYGEPFRHDFEN